MNKTKAIEVLKKHRELVNDNDVLEALNYLIKILSETEVKSEQSYNEKIIDLIESEIISKFRFTFEELRDKSRKEKIRSTRQIAMYLISEYTELKPKSIGEIFNRDRATVLHAINVVNDLNFIDKGFRSEIEILKNRINEQLKHLI